MSQLIKPCDPEWTDWLEICDYTGWNPNGLLQPMRYHGRIIPYSKELGVGPTFHNELMERINKVKPIRIAIVGEAGSSKTYTAIEIARTIDKTFTLEQVVLRGKDYMHLVRILKSGQPIVLEEPTFHLAARTWFKDWQRIIVQTIESTRFQNNPLMIPVVNLNLLDKTVREYYVNYVIHMFDRGIGRVYRTKHSQWQDQLTRRTGFDICVYTPGVELARCGRETCLGCKELHNGCEKYIWPKYERKREEVIGFYQEKGEEAITKAEKVKLTFREMCAIACDEREELRDRKGRYNAAKVQLRFECGYQVAQRVISIMYERHPLPPRKSLSV